MSDPTQRWRERRERWVPHRTPFAPSEFGVEVLARHVDARAFVERHHYSGSWVAARLVVGLYRRVGCLRSHLAGVLAFSEPMQPAALVRHAKVAGTVEGVELGRLVLLDEVGYNGESWFVSRCLDALRRELPLVRGVLSYSDPMPRSARDGRVVTPGHVGVVYQALGAAYVGLGSAQTLHLDVDGRTIARRGLDKIRRQERGCIPAEARLVAAGADPRRPDEEPREWVARVLPGFARVRHPGNHAYVWRLDGERLASLPYPRHPKRRTE